jgi:hypothetical protein
MSDRPSNMISLLPAGKIRCLTTGELHPEEPGSSFASVDCEVWSKTLTTTRQTSVVTHDLTLKSMPGVQCDTGVESGRFLATDAIPRQSFPYGLVDGAFSPAPDAARCGTSCSCGISVRSTRICTGAPSYRRSVAPAGVSAENPIHGP